MRGRAFGSGTWAFCLCAERTFCPLYGFSGMKFRWTQKLEVYVPGALQPNRVPGCLHFHSIENPIRIFRIVCEVVCSVASNVTLDVDGAAGLQFRADPLITTAVNDCVDVHVTSER